MIVHTARAQTSQNAMVAEALFEDGQKLLTAGKTAEACEKFASSQKLDPATGTLLNLAACHEKLGKTATAWLEFSDAYSQAGKQADKQRMAFARSHMDSLEKQLYRVVIEVMKPHKNLSVKLDGSELAHEAIGTGIPLDPGAHEIVVTQPGKKNWKRTLNAGSGGTDRIEVPELEDQEYGFPKIEGQPDPKPEDKPLDNNPPPQDQTTGKKGSSGLMYAGIGVAGVGVAGVVVGAIFGITTLGQASDRDKLCPPNTPCRSQAAFDADYNAKVDQTVSIIFLVGGGVAVAAGVTMIVMGLGQKKAAAQTTTTGLVVSPAFGPGLTGGFVGGRF
jgi:hypothetical protein